MIYRYLMRVSWLSLNNHRSDKVKQPQASCRTSFNRRDQSWLFPPKLYQIKNPNSQVKSFFQRSRFKKHLKSNPSSKELKEALSTLKSSPWQMTTSNQVISKIGLNSKGEGKTHLIKT